MAAPSTRDVRLLVAGLVALLISVLAIPFRPSSTPGVQAAVRVAGFVFLVALVALPALLFRGLRGDWRGFTVWLGKGLLVLTGLTLVGHVRRATNDEPSGLLGSLKNGRVTIDRFLRAERAVSPAVFDQALLRRHERGLRESVTDRKLSNVSLVDVTEGDGWIRAHMTYGAAYDESGLGVNIKGHIVLYYHSRGSAIVGGECVLPAGCQRAESLVAKAEMALRRQLHAPDLDGVLPDSEACSTDSVTVPAATTQLQVRRCAYEEDLQLTFTRFDAPTTVASLIAERTSVR